MGIFSTIAKGLAVVNPVLAVQGIAAGGAGLIGAEMSSEAANDAAQAQVHAANRATDLQRDQYNQTRADQEPWRQAGATALSGMQDKDFQRDFTGADFQKDPGYDFRMKEGQKALERSAAARGGLQSGGTLKALSRYGQDYASNEYGNAYNRFNSDRDRRFNRLSTLAGYGQNANSANGAAGQSYANSAGNNIMGAANAQGAATIASANAWGGAISDIGNNVRDIGAMGMTGGMSGAGGNWMSLSRMAQGGK